MRLMLSLAAALNLPPLQPLTGIAPLTGFAPSRCAPPQAGVRGPPPIPSRQFEALSSPDNFGDTIQKARRNQITVVKFQAPWCRTCRAMAPKLDSVAKRYPSAKYYSIESIRNGKAAGERMHKFFMSHNAVRVEFARHRVASVCHALTPGVALARRRRFPTSKCIVGESLWKQLLSHRPIWRS